MRAWTKITNRFKKKSLALEPLPNVSTIELPVATVSSRPFSKTSGRVPKRWRSHANRYMTYKQWHRQRWAV